MNKVTDNLAWMDDPELKTTADSLQKTMSAKNNNGQEKTNYIIDREEVTISTNNNNVVETDSTYEPPLTEVEKVLVKVPKEGLYMESMSEHTLVIGGEKVKIPTHWRNGKLMGDGVILTCHYYGISRTDLDKRVCATVKVIQKTVADGRQFILLDIHKNGSSEARATTELKLAHEKRADNDIHVTGTKQRYIHFKSLE